MGKEVFTPEGESLGEVLDVTLFSFARVRELLVQTSTGVQKIQGDRVERVEVDRILLKDVMPVNE